MEVGNLIRNSFFSYTNRDPSTTLRRRKKRLQWKDLVKESQIGKGLSDRSYSFQGSFGKVYRGRWTKYGESFVALHEMHEKLEQDTELELQIRHLRQLTLHPNMLRVYGLVENKKAKRFYLVTEFMPWEDLTSFLVTHQETLQEQHRLKLLIGIATGMCHIHNCRLVHRTLSTDNVLVGADYSVKLAELGYLELMEMKLGKESDKKERPDRIVAPEYCETNVWTKKSDVYTFGIVAMEIFGNHRQNL